MLVQWQTQSLGEATWEPLREFEQDFPTFNLEDKVSLEAKDNVEGPTIMDKTPMAQWTRKNQRVGRKPTKFADYV